MADARKRYPSLPPNYISIIQLKERCMRGQEQQQKKEQEQKASLDKPNEEKGEIQSKAAASRFTAPLQSHPKNKYRWVVKASSQKPEGSKINKSHGDMEEELKIKEDFGRVETWRKPGADEELAGGTILQASRIANEKFPGRANQMATMYQRMEKLSAATSTDVISHPWNPALSQTVSSRKATGAGLVWVRKGERSGGSGRCN